MQGFPWPVQKNTTWTWCPFLPSIHKTIAWNTNIPDSSLCMQTSAGPQVCSDTSCQPAREKTSGGPVSPPFTCSALFHQQAERSVCPTAPFPEETSNLSLVEILREMINQTLFSTKIRILSTAKVAEGHCHCLCFLLNIYKNPKNNGVGVGKDDEKCLTIFSIYGLPSWNRIQRPRFSSSTTENKQLLGAMSGGIYPPTSLGGTSRPSLPTPWLILNGSIYWTLRGVKSCEGPGAQESRRPWKGRASAQPDINPGKEMRKKILKMFCGKKFKNPTTKDEI